MIRYQLQKHRLIFNFPAKTSRSSLQHKDSWFIFLQDDSGKTGIGEIAPLEGLSPEYIHDFEPLIHLKVQESLADIPSGLSTLADFPSIQFGLETAWRSLQSSDPMILFPGLFTEGRFGIPINGLVWMGELDFMMQQLHEKIEKGFRCIKIKIGAIDFEDELSLLKTIRNRYSNQELEIRLDANGAFAPSKAMQLLDTLASFSIHSIEQPIKAGQYEEMARICQESPIPVALDEELIGITSLTAKRELLQQIKPQYIILKPSLAGGFEASEAWIQVAGQQGIGHWVTSALESNIGLNAIAQWSASLKPQIPQGLGTGQLYSNNIPSPLHIQNDSLYYLPEKSWELHK